MTKLPTGEPSRNCLQITELEKANRRAHVALRVSLSITTAPNRGRLASHPKTLPTTAARLALEWPGQLWRDPPAIKTSRLCEYLCSAHGAIEIVSVKSDALSQRLGPSQGLWIAPSDSRQATLTINQIPISRRAFPLAERSVACRTQQRTLNIGQRQVERGRVRGLSHRPGGARSSHL